MMVQRARYPWLHYVQQLAAKVPNPQLDLPFPANVFDGDENYRRSFREAAAKKSDSEWKEVQQHSQRNSKTLARLKARCAGEEPPNIITLEVRKKSEMGWNEEIF